MTECSGQAESLISASTDGISIGSQFCNQVGEAVQVVALDQHTDISYDGNDEAETQLNIAGTEHLAEIVTTHGGNGPIHLACNEPFINSGQNEISDLSQFTTDGQQILITGSNQTASLGTAVINGETVQIIQVHNGSTDLVTSGRDDGGKVWHLVPAGTAANMTPDVCSVIAVSPEELEAACKDRGQAEGGEVMRDEGHLEQDLSGLLPPVPQMQAVPPGTPSWALRLYDLQKIGNSYRGWVATEVELDLLLTLHKQRTQSFWGTRQSPASNKPSTRLMWKSQYVPFDGVPFLNSGSRAIVMECQFGPRRKGGTIGKQSGVPKTEFRQTCPARIYIKKVRKFPAYAVDVNVEKKALHMAMAKNFQKLKENLSDAQGYDKFYVELPTEKAHEFHESLEAEPAALASRLDPRVIKEIRTVVSGGETRLYVIRKRLRKFVEKELFERSPQVPEKHDQCFFPTVTDLQNHIHQAVKDLESGVLMATSRSFTVEVAQESTSSVFGARGWPHVKSDAVTSPHAESVTVTLTQAPDQDGQHMISRVETHMSDGTTQYSTSLTPETAKLLAKLHPNMFQAGSIFQGHEPDDLRGEDKQTVAHLPHLSSTDHGPQAMVDTLLDDDHIAVMGQSAAASNDATALFMAAAAAADDTNSVDEGDHVTVEDAQHAAVSDIKMEGYDGNQTYAVVVEDGKVKELVEVTDVMDSACESNEGMIKHENEVEMDGGYQGVTSLDQLL